MFWSLDSMRKGSLCGHWAVEIQIGHEEIELQLWGVGGNNGEIKFVIGGWK